MTSRNRQSLVIAGLVFVVAILAISLAEHSARARGVIVPDDQRGAQLALLVRGGCTLSPDAYLFTVIDRAILAEKDRLPKR